MSNDDTFYYLALRFVPGLGNVTARRLLKRFSHARAIFTSSVSELSSVKGVKRGVVKEILSFSAEAEVKRELERIHEKRVDIVCWHDSDYPPLLREIHDPPPFLYKRGTIRPSDKTALAVVGTRSPTQYGRDMTRELVKGLVHRGFTIVSGLARGIDAEAHRASLDFGGRTIAIMGCGIDEVYPRENSSLYRKIAHNGALLTEFGIGLKPEPHHFPIRNRIINGISLGVLVVEAAQKSGSLITARYASSEGREVFAVPGSPNSPKSIGTNSLIQQGAKLVGRPEDIFEEIAQTPPLKGKPGDDESENEAWKEVTKREMKILCQLGRKPVHFDSLVRGSGMSVPEVSGCLLTLILKQALIELPGKLYMRKS